MSRLKRRCGTGGKVADIITSVAERALPDRAASLKTIEQLLNYLVVEAAELRLPLLVYVLRLGQLELEKAIEQEQGAASTH